MRSEILKNQRAESRLRIGQIQRRVLVLLYAGLALSLARNPRTGFKILKLAHKEWQKINKYNLQEAIRKLYQSKLIKYKQNNDGTITLVLNEKGKKLALRYNLDNIKINKPERWDNLWRIVSFDIPEYYKKGRDALSSKLKQLGFYPMQKSVFILPYDCKKEIDFITEIFGLRPFVRLIIAKETDIDLDLKNKFKL
ncbi:MAG: hypothetical protein LiPW39_579 [Parcubacteria group bacterium LiPW_39]|nr:MAG: hypothetical protein LiPW39_579 [Parcubacteria group bacterium LiPW_39]